MKTPTRRETGAASRASESPRGAQPRSWRSPLAQAGAVPAEAADLAKLRSAGVSEAWATQQSQLYREVAKLNPANPTAALRAEWLEAIAVRLRGAQ